MLSNCIYYNWILLSLLLEEITRSDLREAEYVGKVSVLIPCKLCDVTLCNFLESQLLLHFFQVLCPLPLPRLIKALAPLLLFLGAHPLHFHRLVLILPFSLDIICQFTKLELLEFPNL